MLVRSDLYMEMETELYMEMETHLAYGSSVYDPLKFYTDFRSVFTAFNRINSYSKDSEAYLYMYCFFSETSKESLVDNVQLIEQYGVNYKGVLAEWNNYATPKGLRLYRKSRYYSNKPNLVSKDKWSIFNLFLKATPKRPLTKARNIQGLKSENETMAQRELIKELLMTEINQKTNHIDLHILEIESKMSFRFKIGADYHTCLNINLLDMSVHGDVNIYENLPYEETSGVDPTQIVLTRNPKKLINNLLTYMNTCEDLKILSGYAIRKQIKRLNHFIEDLISEVSYEELSDLFTYCDSAYNSENITKEELAILKSLSGNSKLKFTKALREIQSSNDEYVVTYVTLMALNVFNDVNNTSESPLDSMPQDIIDFSIKHVDVIVAELINYVNVLEKYGYIVTD